MRNWLQIFDAGKEPDLPLSWQSDSIKDSWFHAHFHYAADVVNEWLGEAGTSGVLLDFGCGDGITGLGLMLRHGYKAVEGMDISTTHQGLMALANREIKLSRLPQGLRFTQIHIGEKIVTQRPFDSIISWSVFEHIGRMHLESIVSNLFELLTPGGQIFIQINPLYFSPQGSHLGRFQLPDWAHLSWTKERIAEEVMAYQGDIPLVETEENFHTRTFYEYKKWVLNEFELLNQITARELLQLFEVHGFELVREAYGRVENTLPGDLLKEFDEEVLRTEEVRFLFRRPI